MEAFTLFEKKTTVLMNANEKKKDDTFIDGGHGSNRTATSDRRFD